MVCRIIAAALLGLSSAASAQQTFTFALSGTGFTFVDCFNFHQCFIIVDGVQVPDFPDPARERFTWSGSLVVTVPDGDGTFDGHDLHFAVNATTDPGPQYFGVGLFLDFAAYGDELLLAEVAPAGVTVLDGVIVDMTTLGVFDFGHYVYQQSTGSDGSFGVTYAYGVGHHHSGTTNAFGFGVPAVAAVPEPETFALLLAGLAAVAGRRTILKSRST